MKNAKIGFGLSTLLLLALVGCGGGDSSAPAPAADAPPPAPPVDLSQTGSLAGVVTFSNGDDPDIVIKMDADPVCAGLHSGPVESETRLADGSNLANVFVYVKSGLEGSFNAPAEPASLNQEGCLYTPRVSGIMVGQTLKVVNTDPTLHNVHAVPSNNPEFNQAQPFQGMELERVFESSEVMIPFKCDVHPWMQSYVAVLDHPFFGVSGTNGSFSIEGIPAGTYTVEAWHELFGTQTSEVTIGAGDSTDVAFSFGG